MFIKCTEIIVGEDDSLKAVPAIFEFRGLNVNDKGQIVLSALGGDRYTVFEANTGAELEKIVADGVLKDARYLNVAGVKAVRAVRKGTFYEDAYFTRGVTGSMPLSDFLNSKSVPVSSLLGKTSTQSLDEQLTEAMALFDDI